MTTQSLSVRLTALFESNKFVLQLIHRLSKLHFQPGSSPLNGDDDVRLELSSEIHDSLKQVEEELELLRQEVDELNVGVANAGRRDSEKDRERLRLAIQVSKLGEDLKSSRSQFRKAQLQAKRNAELARQKERELLFSSLHTGTTTSANRARGQEKSPADEVLVTASSDVTAALRRTHQLMQSELERSRFAQESLDQSTAALVELGEHYTNLDTLLSNSRTLLSSLLRSQKSDTWYLETTFYILITTIIWLVFRRLLYGPLWWFIWLPLKLGYKLLFSVFTTLNYANNTNTTTTVSTTLSTTVSIDQGPTILPEYQ
ncbi:Sec20-domain-containing protein [Lepidopterella palustris CBS 459.81]|uniref:Sec20-domain-containing protein n=1 Tax=Lepidopterella palustris CBS 459.81 TaxID=1314670 RepID=A0A8E2E8I6_9PEZI|nr:Sec20-domain-containing protein [Lepidopterella palustris CBS 459.81]